MIKTHLLTYWIPFWTKVFIGMFKTKVFFSFHRVAFPYTKQQTERGMIWWSDINWVTKMTHTKRKSFIWSIHTRPWYKSENIHFFNVYWRNSIHTNVTRLNKYSTVFIGSRTTWPFIYQDDIPWNIHIICDIIYMNSLWLACDVFKKVGQIHTSARYIPGSTK